MQKQYRLTKRSDFNKVYRLGNSLANRQFVMYYRKLNNIEHYKLGVSVSKRVGNAVVRNRIKRRIKEIVRLKSDVIQKHTQLILIVRKPAIDMDYYELEKSIVHIMRKAGILLRNNAHNS